MREEEIMKNDPEGLNEKAWPPGERRAFLERAKDSPESRRKLTADNPSAIFSLLSLQEKEESFWQDLWPGVSSEISRPALWRTIITAPVRAYRPALAVCAAVLLLAVTGIYVLRDGGQPAVRQGVSTVLFQPAETDRFSDVPVLENIEPVHAVVLDMGIIDEGRKTRLYHLTNVDLEL
jgi:hypothetical protein